MALANKQASQPNKQTKWAGIIFIYAENMEKEEKNKNKL